MMAATTNPDSNSALRAIVDWAASALSMAAAMGWINLAVGVLSALWIATQLYKFWAFELATLRSKRRQSSPKTPPPTTVIGPEEA